MPKSVAEKGRKDAVNRAVDEANSLSDREIDALVAEKVMGWTLFEGPDYTLVCDPDCSVDRPQRSVTVSRDETTKRAIPDRFPPGKHAWHPSTDPVASKQLRDEMRKRGWFWLLQLRQDSGACLMRFWRDSDDGEDVIEADANAPTEERAICIAALRAIAGEERKP